jgi:transposase-like protein
VKPASSSSRKSAQAAPAKPAASPKAIIKRVKAALSGGAYLYEILAAEGLSLNQWYRLCQQQGVKISATPGPAAVTYTPERVKIVKARINAGERLKDVAEELGLDPRNLARYCRQNGIQLFSERARQRSYQQRAAKMRGQLRAPYKTRNGKPVKRPEIEKLLAQGMTIDEVALRCDVTAHYVYSLRKSLPQTPAQEPRPEKPAKRTMGKPPRP